MQSGEIDVLVRNTGWSLTREASLGLLFAGVNFWDGTSIIVKTASGVKSVKALEGATICVLPGTTTELDLADWARAENIKYTPVLIGSLTEIRQAFLAGRCDGYTTDSSQVAGFRFMQGAKANELTILPEPIGLGPSGAMVRKGDDKWYDIVRWTHFATLVAESLGVTSKNIDSFADTKIPDIRRLLGMESDLGKSMGLDAVWAANIIRQVGNYGELFERDIHPVGKTGTRQERAVDQGRTAVRAAVAIVAGTDKARARGSSRVGGELVSPMRLARKACAAGQGAARTCSGCRRPARSGGASGGSHCQSDGSEVVCGRNIRRA